MNAQSQVMAIIPHESDLEFANQIVDRGDGTLAHIVIGSPLEAVPEFARRSHSPHYLLIDVGERGHDILPEIDTIAEYCEAGTRVVVIGYVNDVSFYRELKTRGISEYFTKPVKIADVRSMLFAKQHIATGRKGEVISCISAASADGASTVSINTAYALATEYNKSVVLVDMDYQFGMIAKNLDLTTQFGIKELFENPDRGIDSTLIERMLLTYKDSRLRVIAAPNQLNYIPEVHDELVSHLIATLSNDFDFVVIDLPHIWTPLISSAIIQSTRTIMVAQLWLRSITHSSRLLATWRRMGIKDAQISLVANRSGAKFKEAVSQSDFERVCGLPFVANFDNDTKTVITAENNGRTILEGSNSDLSRQFRKFAGFLCKADSDMNSGTAVKSRLAGLMNRK